VKGEHVLIQPKHLIRELDSILKSTFPKSIELIVDIGKNLWMVQGDATQLHQVMLNLCVNARDAMPDGGKLTIKVENVGLDDQYARMHIDAKPGNYVLVSVQDTGSGIPPGIIDKIFDPFFTTKEVGKGTGLGLSTVMTIVKNHGGFLNVHSEVNTGSVFKVYIPAAAGAEWQEQQPVSESPHGHGELILVVEDEAAVRDVMVHSLEANGYRVSSAKDGAEALALYAQMMRDVAAVITDIMMPILDGPATIRALRKMNPDVKIVAISGLTAEAKVQEVTSLVVSHILSKPFTTEKLLVTLHAVVTGSQTAPQQ
jgi:two-component system cell cycle sensor histidine kinase/response regulator CckA